MPPPERREVAPPRSPFGAEPPPPSPPPAPPPAPAAAPPPSDEKLFAPEDPAEGCASGDCVPAAAQPEPAPALVLESPLPPASPTADQWRAAVDRVRKASTRHGASLAFGRLLWIRPGEVALAYPRSASFHKATITAQSGRALIEKALTEHFGAPTRLVVEEAAELAAAAAPSLAEEEAKNRDEHEKSTDAMVRAHPAVRAALRHLGGEVEHIQVFDRPRPDALQGEDEVPEPPEQTRPE